MGGLSTPQPPAAAPVVVCVGVLVVDVHARPAAALPPPERADLLDEVRLTAAGTAAATAVDLARLGCRAAVQGTIGEDPAGDLLLQLLRSADVDVSGVVRIPGAATSMSVLPVDAAGDRRIWHFRGANALLNSDHIDGAMLRAADAVHLGGPDVLTGLSREDVARLFDDVRRQGALTSMDLLSNLPTLPARSMQEWLPLVDVVAVNTHQALVITGANDPDTAARLLHEWGADWAAVTCGSAGSVVATDGGVVETPAFAVPVVDTTGCGDAFSAGLLVARLAGDDVATAARFANAAAALVATGLGSDAGLVDREQVAEFAEMPTLHSPTSGAGRYPF